MEGNGHHYAARHTCAMKVIVTRGESYGDVFSVASQLAAA